MEIEPTVRKLFMERLAQTISFVSLLICSFVSQSSDKIVFPILPENAVLSVLSSPEKRTENILFNVSRDTPLRVIDEKAHWFQVEHDGMNGFVHKTLVQNPTEHEYIEIHALSSGQGDTHLIHCPNGINILYDAGSLSRQADSSLKQSFISAIDHHSRFIDYIIVSHPDLEHYSLIPFLTESISVGTVFFVGTKDDYSVEFWNWLGTVKSVNIRSELELNQHSIDCGAAIINFLSAGLESGPINELSNTMSIVMSVQLNNFEILLTGDATRETKEYILENTPDKNRLEHDVISMSYQNNKVSSDPIGWLASLKPKVALMSAGRGDRYWNPRQLSLEQLESLLPELEQIFMYAVSKKIDGSEAFEWMNAQTNKAILQTPITGDIRLRSDGNKISF